MTRLHVLGSGSKGNAFVLETDGQLLLVEAGFSARETLRRFELAGLDPANLVGIAITHEHGDHARGAVRVARKVGIPIVTSGGTWRRLSGRGSDLCHVSIGYAGQGEVGPFTVSGSPIVHDAAEPLALAVTCSDGVRVGFAFDLGRATTAVRYLLRDMHGLVVESNYDDLLLRTSGYPPTVQARIAGFAGHLSNRLAAELIGELHHGDLQAVILAHLSQNCNAPERAKATTGAILKQRGFTGSLAVASQATILPPIMLNPPLTLWPSEQVTPPDQGQEERPPSPAGATVDRSESA